MPSGKNHNQLQHSIKNQVLNENQNAQHYSEDDESQENYELIPRQFQTHKINKDQFLIYRSVPYKPLVQTYSNINLIQHSSIQSAYENNSQGLDQNNINQLEINQSFISKSSSQQNKNISFPIDNDFQMKLQELNHITIQNKQSEVIKFNEAIQKIEIFQNLEHGNNYRFSFGAGQTVLPDADYGNQAKRQYAKVQTVQSQTVHNQKSQISNSHIKINISSSERKSFKEMQGLHQDKNKYHQNKRTDFQNINTYYQPAQSQQQNHSHISIQKHQGYQKTPRTDQYNNLIRQNKMFNEKIIESQHQLELNKIKIDQLRDQLIKSSQNNINALFNTQIHEQVCLIHQVQKIKTQVETIKNRLGTFGSYPSMYQVNSLHNCTGHRQNCLITDQFQHIQANNKNLSKKYYQLGEHIGNVQQKQNKFSRQLQRLKAQFQRNVMEKVEDLLNLKLMKQKNSRQLRQIQQFQELQYNPTVWTQNTCHQDEQFDDSRGSISVIYIQRLRQFENLVWEKEKEINQVKKQNQFLRRSLDKLQAIRYQDRKKQTTKNSGQNRPEDKQQSKLFRKKNNLFQLQDSISIDEQKIRQNLIGKSQETPIDFVNKRKNTHSFHQSKNIRQKAVQQLQQKLNTYELIIKEKDIRIKQLQNTIMDHLQTNNFQRNKNESYSFHSISADSKEQNTEILQSKVHNLKTLLNQARRQTKKLKLQLQQSYTYNKSGKNTINSKEDSQVTKSMCRSEKTIKNNQKNYQADKKMNPFQQLEIQQKRNQPHNEQLKFLQSAKYVNQKLKILPFITEALNIIQNLKQIVICLCSQKVQKQNIQNSIKGLFKSLKECDQHVYQRIKSTNVMCREFS